MLVLTEAEVGRLLTPEMALAAVEAVFRSMDRGSARNFPVVREALGEGRQYGFKSGFDGAGGALGLKSGGYFPGNAGRGIANHQSTVMLFNPDSGQPEAMVAGNLLTALRTAAASALAIRVLARPGARVLGMIGAGHQAAFQLRAAAAVGGFDRVLGWNRTPERLDALARVAADLGLGFEPATPERIGAEAGVIVTITSSFGPILTEAMVAPGAHVSAMGTDTRGKQELSSGLVAGARLFTDEVAQSVSIGEAQHAVAAGLVDASAITPIGAVLNGKAPGRSSGDEITIFDGTGVGLQDLAVAADLAARARAAGLGREIEV